MNPKFKDIYHTEIPPIPINGSQPLWSVIIPTYNCANYLKDTLISVLQQDPGEDKMEIIVVDDCSTKDNPREVVENLGKGRVKFYQQIKNVGKVKNYETGLQMSHGDLIHILHGDDLVSNGFYHEMEQIFSNNTDAKAAFCRTIYIDEQGRWRGMTGMIQEQEGLAPTILEKLYVQQQIQTPSMVVKREVYENIGAFDRRLNCMEDWEMWIRIANNYSIAVSNKVLAYYRTHDKNATNITFDNGSAFTTHKKVFEIVDTYVDKRVKQNFFKKRKKKQADFLILSYKLRQSKLTKKEKIRFLRHILALNSSPANFIRLFRS